MRLVHVRTRTSTVRLAVRTGTGTQYVYLYRKVNCTSTGMATYCLILLCDKITVNAVIAMMWVSCLSPANTLNNGVRVRARASLQAKIPNAHTFAVFAEVLVAAVLLVHFSFVNGMTPTLSTSSSVDSSVTCTLTAPFEVQLDDLRAAKWTVEPAAIDVYSNELDEIEKVP